MYGPAVVRFAFTRMNVGPIILENQIEDRIEVLELSWFFWRL